jgi:hypothetical protein
MPSLSRRLDVRTEWTLAVALQIMTASALTGPTVRRTQTVVEHLDMASQSCNLSIELRTACANLVKYWRIIDLQKPPAWQSRKP